jgi:hypothetical protein
MWVSLDRDTRSLPIRAGSGITDHYKPVAVYPIEALLSDAAERTTDENEPEPEEEHQFTTIAEVVAWPSRPSPPLSGSSYESQVRLNRRSDDQSQNARLVYIQANSCLSVPPCALPRRKGVVLDGFGKARGVKIRRKCIASRA